MKLNKTIITVLLLLSLLSCSKKDNMEISFKAIMENKEIKKDCLTSLDPQELRILRNTIFARHGYQFKSEELQYYFYSPGAKPYGYNFVGSKKFKDTNLSEQDKLNIKLIQNYEKESIVENSESATKIINKTKTTINDVFNQYLILTHDLYSYFPEIGREYNTELKRKKFEETEEYQKLYDKILELENDLYDQRYVREVTNYIKIHNYNLDDKGFYIQLPYNDGYWTYYDAAEMGKDHEEITELAGYISKDHYYSFINDNTFISQITYYYCIFIPCSEEEGLLIENNLESFRLFIEFDIAHEGHRVGYNMGSNGIQYNPRPLVMTTNGRYLLNVGDKTVVSKGIKM